MYLLRTVLGIYVYSNMLAIFFSNSYENGKDCVFIHESESFSVVSNSLQPNGLYSPWNSPGQNIEVGRISLFQGIFPTQGSNSALPHCRQILHQVSHKGSSFVFIYA